MNHIISDLQKKLNETDASIKRHEKCIDKSKEDLKNAKDYQKSLEKAIAKLKKK